LSRSYGHRTTDAEAVLQRFEAIQQALLSKMNALGETRGN
jgi:hypothetical protein